MGFVVGGSKSLTTTCETDADTTAVNNKSLGTTDLRGLHGETCYLLIRDYHSNMLMGQCQATKAADLPFLRKWLMAHQPAVDHKFVRFDNGELGTNRAVVDLFESFRYGVQTTGPDSSDQNGKVERPHQDIGRAMRA